MSGPVLWHVEPIPTEGLMSLVTRTVTKNILPSSHELLKHVGVGHANNPTAAITAELDEDKLAAILRQPLGEVRCRRFHPREHLGFVDSFGVAVRSDEIVFRRRRFGPTATGASPHARAIWSLKMVPCCTEEWEYLVDACACGTIQRWQSADRLDRCDACNAPLAAVSSTVVDQALRDGVGFLVGLLDPDLERREHARAQLPPALAEWDGGFVFELALAIMPLTMEGFIPKRGQQPTAADAPKYITSLAQAAEIIRGWPESLIPALTERMKVRAVSWPEIRYKGTVHYLAGLASSVLPTNVRAALSDALAPITSMAGVVPPDQIGMREAALLTGQDEAKLASARRATLLKTRICFRANRVMPTLDRKEVESLDDFLKNRVGPEAASLRLHLPQYAIGQLAEEGLLIANDHPYVVEHYGVGQIHNAELSLFQDRLREAGSPCESIGDPVPLHSAARAIGGGPKPWGKILRSLVAGEIAYSIEAGSIDRILISRENANSLHAFRLSDQELPLVSGCISQRDATEILNLPLKHAHILKGDRAAGGAYRIPWLQVRLLAQTQITLAELSALTGIQPTRLESILKNDGCPRHNAFGWIRGDALATIASYTSN